MYFLSALTTFSEFGAFTMDGVWAGAGMANAALNGGGAVTCPNNVCQGLVDYKDETTQYSVYVASAGTAQTYKPVSQEGATPYDPNGAFLTPGQFQKTIQSAVNAQRATFVQAVADFTGLDPNKVNAAVSPAQNDDGTTKVDGGNVQFEVTGDVGDQLAADLGDYSGDPWPDAPSIHLHETTGLYHLDTMDPYSGYGWGLLVHFSVDVFAGSILYGPVPLPRQPQP
jgi:hypothetical protein